MIFRMENRNARPALSSPDMARTECRPVRSHTGRASLKGLRPHRPADPWAEFGPATIEIGRYSQPPPWFSAAFVPQFGKVLANRIAACILLIQ
jgi:hypothetical protein